MPDIPDIFLLKVDDGSMPAYQEKLRVFPPLNLGSRPPSPHLDWFSPLNACQLHDCHANREDAVPVSNKYCGKDECNFLYFFVFFLGEQDGMFCKHLIGNCRLEVL